MLQVVINNLEQIDNEIAKELLWIYKGEEPNVYDNFYESTIFGSQAGYFSAISYINGNIIGSVNKKIVESPLVFVRGDRSGFWSSLKNKGVDFGCTLVDYVTKKPLIVCTITLNNDKYDYKSIIWDKQTNGYVSSINTSVGCANIDELLEFVSEKINLDIDKFVKK